VRYLVKEGVYRMPKDDVAITTASPCKKREGFSTWKGKSQRIAEKGGRVYVYVGISIKNYCLYHSISCSLGSPH
jgi:hypothetical protein